MVTAALERVCSVTLTLGRQRKTLEVLGGARVLSPRLEYVSGSRSVEVVQLHLAAKSTLSEGELMGSVLRRRIIAYGISDLLLRGVGSES